MKASIAKIGSALDRADPAIRLYLLYGTDEAGARALGTRLEQALGAGSERIDLDSAVLKDDPARLATEAASPSLFGGRCWIRAELGSAVDVMPAIEALLGIQATSNPVVLIGGALKSDSILLKRLDREPDALSCELRKPTGESAERVAVAVAREAGLRLGAGIAGRLAAACAGDRMLIASEIAKYALYLDAAPDRPCQLDDDVLDALGAEAREGDFGRLANALLDGRANELAEGIALLAEQGIVGIPVIRTVAKRLLGQTGEPGTGGVSRARAGATSRRRA